MTGTDIGFEFRASYGDAGDGLSFAIVSFGAGDVMFSSGGQLSSRHRRDVDLYFPDAEGRTRVHAGHGQRANVSFEGGGQMMSLTFEQDGSVMRVVRVH